MIMQQQLITINNLSSDKYSVIICGNSVGKQKPTWILEFDFDKQAKKTLHTKSGEVRKFKSLNTVYDFIVKHCNRAKRVSVISTELPLTENNR